MRDTTAAMVGIGAPVFASLFLFLFHPSLPISALPPRLNTPTFLYQDFCSDEIAHTTEWVPARLPHLGFRRGSFTGGTPLFPISPSSVFSVRRAANAVFLDPSNVALSNVQDHRVYLVEATLYLRNRTSPIWSDASPVYRRGFGLRPPRFFRSAAVTLTLKGVWLSGSRTLCMAGCFRENQTYPNSGRQDCHVKAVFHYPSEVTIKQPFVKGTLKSRRDPHDTLFFDPIGFTAVAEDPYVFTEIDDAQGSCYENVDDVPAGINVWKENADVCRFLRYTPLTVDWGGQCSGLDCSPFQGMDVSHEATLSIENMVCEEGKVHGFMILHSNVNSTMVSSVMSVEGKWDVARGQLCATACYLKDATNVSTISESYDCDILISLQFPTTLSLLFRYSVIGHVKRRKNSKFPSFMPFQFVGNMDILYGRLSWMNAPPQLKYSYTAERIKQAAQKCHENTQEWSSKTMRKTKTFKYPDGYIFSDLEFKGKIEDSSGSIVDIHFFPVAINQRINRNHLGGVSLGTSSVPFDSKSGRMFVSFELSVELNQKDSKLFLNTSSTSISAEGAYHSKTGILCLIACRRLIGSLQYMNLDDGDKDCQIHITVQYPPMNSWYFGEHRITGEVISLRKDPDKLFFSSIKLTSDPMLYQKQAANVLMQMDVEILMGIVSLTLAALFTGLQLRHVKKNPKVLSQMSLLMLLVLTVGYLLPLVLNFEAIFSSRSRQNIPLWQDGWLEANEVIVRLMTMVVFLLILRLLYLTWVEKCLLFNDRPWQAEKDVLLIYLVTSVLLSLIGFIVCGIKSSRILDVIKACAGFIVDFFLFPQILGNYVWEVHGTILSPAFCFGMTFVRSLPHLYDIVRRFEFFSTNSRRYYYANPNWDFYSDAWDVIMPSGALFCAIFLFLQQCYGGRFLSMRLFRKRSYEIVSSDPL